MKKLNKKSLTYWYYRLVKQNGSPESLARGVAIGLFCGFLFPIGTQSIVAIPTAIILRASKILAFAFTWITNHVTILFIYPFQIVLGSYIIARPLSFDSVSEELKAIGPFKELTLGKFFDLGSTILIPFFVGGLTLAVIFAFLGYFTSYGLVVRHRQKRKMRLDKKLAPAAHRD